MEDRCAGIGVAGDDGQGVPWRAWLAVGRAVGVRPHLWSEAVRQGRLMLRPRGRAWLRFRLVTAYGTARALPVPSDVVAWLEWSRRCRRASSFE